MNRLTRQKGSILVFFLLMIVFLFSMIAISVDVGHLFLVQAELRKAADAASLTGAAYLYPTADEGGPNWELAEQKALEAVALNTADGSFLSTAIIETGYWDLTGEEDGIRDPDSVLIPNEDDIAAVRVIIAREPGQNGGAVPLFFASFVGVPTKDVSAESVAGAGAPRSVNENTLFPTVFPSSLYDEFWNYSTQKPKIDPSTGNPYIFEIGKDDKHGTWTSFEENVNNVPYMRDLIANGNPEKLSIGQNIYVVNGAKTTLYNSVPSNVDVGVAILTDTQSSGIKEIVGFGSMHIHFASGGSKKTITVSLIENLKTEGGSPVGGSYRGSYVPPKLLR